MASTLSSNHCFLFFRVIDPFENSRNTMALIPNTHMQLSTQICLSMHPRLRSLITDPSAKCYSSPRKGVTTFLGVLWGALTEGCYLLKRTQGCNTAIGVKNSWKGIKL